jgi:hypothetical protein
VVDGAAVPDGLEDPVPEAQDEQVLDGLLAQVVVDAQDLVLVEVLVQGVVQGAGAAQVVAERLLDDDPALLARLPPISPNSDGATDR